MSFREKSTWISFVLLLVVLGGYLWPIADASFGGEGDRNLLHYFLALLLGFAALQVVLRVLVALRSPQDARAPKDERERLIELRAARIGFYALVAGVLLALLAMHVLFSLRVLAQSVMLALLVAWLVKLGSELVYYRRGG
jgi:hypothetical protein